MVQPRPIVSTCDHCTNIEADLSQIEPVIVALTTRISYASLADWEREEITQRVLMKLWDALPGKPIRNLGAYLRKTVHHEFVSFLRQRKPLAPLALNEDGEPYQGKVLIAQSEGMGEPQTEIEEKEALHQRMDEVVDAIMQLPPVQKVAMVCYIRDHLDDPNLLVEAFQRRNLDITVIQWPEDKVAKQRLQASCRPARLSMAQQMQIDLQTYRGACRERHTAEEPILHEPCTVS